MSLPFRQIHLDFHTSPLIPEVGADFDAEQFARTFRDANVNSVTVFAKCHHGMSYYNTKVGVKHPTLKRDLLREMVTALHRHDIRVPAYISVVWDEWAAAHHPEWRQVNREGKLAGAEPLQAGWRWLCLNTAYVDYVAAQTQEVLQGYDADGVFFDIVMQWECYCAKCVRDMLDAGLQPDNADDARAFARQVSARFLERFRALVSKHKPKAGTYFNSRLRIGTACEKRHYTHQEVESLPTGGWGYAHLPFFARYVRTEWRDWLGMTARFHRTWADFGTLKNEAALEYENFHTIALGGRCSIGDQLHPRGALDREVYARTGRVYQRVAEMEEWCEGAERVADIAILTNCDVEGGRPTDSDDGALRMLLETHCQFDVIDRNGNFDDYSALVIPDRLAADAPTVKKLRSYVKKGGKLLMSHQALTPELYDLAGCELRGESPFDIEYLLPGGAIDEEVPKMPHAVNAHGMVVAPSGAKTLATVGEPYFNRTYAHFTSHQHAPIAKRTRRPAITLSADRRVTYFAHPLFQLYAQHGYVVYRQLVRNALLSMIDSGTLTTSAPSYAHVLLNRQSQRHIVHVIAYAPQRRSRTIDLVEDRIQLQHCMICVKLRRRPQRVYLAPQRQELPFEYRRNQALVRLPLVDGYQAIVFE